jgi:EmrB/QacA subfamily drug resistance transporter
VSATAPTASVAPPGAGPSINPWLVLVIACLAQFMVVLDSSIVNIALPSIQRGLHFSAANLQWVVDGYTLVFGGFLLLGGRAADLLGRRRLFVAGVALFTVASLINGFAQTSGMLIAGRALQGLGGALVSPAALSIVTTTFRDGSQRTRALGVWSAIAAGGAAVGLLAGGVLTDLASWRWVFFVNVPVGILTILLALRFVAESRLDGARRAYDLAGAVTVTGGLVVLVFAIVKAQAWGWGAGRTVALYAVALVLLGASVVIEHRSAAPLMRLGILRIRSLAVADSSLLLVASAMFGMFFFVSLYVQDVLGYSPLTAGLAFLPATAMIMIGAGIAQGIIARVGVRAVGLFGVVLGAIGMVLLLRLSVHGSYVGQLLVGLIPLTLGMGFAFVPLTLLGTSGLPAADAGLASGLFNTAQQVGGSLGLAIMASASASRASSVLHGATGEAARLSAEVSGYHLAFVIGAIMLTTAAALLAFGLRRSHMAEVDRELEATGGAMPAGV